MNHAGAFDKLGALLLFHPKNAKINYKMNKGSENTNRKSVRARVFLSLALLLSAALFSVCVFMTVKDLKNYTQAFNEIFRVYSFEEADNGIKVINPENAVIYSGVYEEAAVSAAIDDDRGEEPFTLRVPAPDVTIRSEGNLVIAPYSEQVDAFTFKADYTHFLGSVYVPTDGYKWYLKNAAENEFTLREGAVYSDVTLGRELASGNYIVRTEFSGVFSFMGKEYPTQMGAAEFSFGVTAGEFCVSLPDDPKYTYGEKLTGKLLNEILFDPHGVWKFCDADYENKVLSAGSYSLKLDFVPNNASYERVSGIDVGIEVLRRVVTVLIYDVSSDQGDDLSALRYDENVSGLAECDSVDKLNIKLKTDADKDGCGVYRIFGSWDNPDYEVKFTNSDDPEGGSFSVDAKYIVYPKKIPFPKPDLSYPDMTADGNGATLPFELQMSLERVNGALKPEGISGELKDVFGIKAILKITDAQGFTRTEEFDYSNGRIYLTLGSVSGADSVAYLQNGKYKTAYFADGAVRIAPDAGSRIYFIKSLSVSAPVDYNAATIALAILIVLCLAAIIILRGKIYGGYGHGKRA